MSCLDCRTRMPNSNPCKRNTTQMQCAVSACGSVLLPTDPSVVAAQHYTVFDVALPCRSVSLCICSSLPLFLSTSVPLSLCSSVPLYLCSSVPLSPVPVCRELVCVAPSAMLMCSGLHVRMPSLPLTRVLMSSCMCAGAGQVTTVGGAEAGGECVVTFQIQVAIK